MNTTLRLLTALLLLPLSLPGQGFPNVPRVPGQLLSGLNAPQQGRTAVIAWHNGWLFTVPESPSSQPGSDLLSRRWDISNPASPAVVETLGVTTMPVMAHGYFHDGNHLVLGANWPPEAPNSWLALPGNGLQRVAYPDLQGVFTRGDLYQPWFAPTYWSYNAVGGDATLSRGGVVRATWDHLGQTGVIGHPFIVGNLLIYASDQSRTGVATYDISDPAQPVLLDILKTGGPGGYWPELWGGNGRLLIVFPYREAPNGMRVVDATDPADLRFLADVPLPGNECMYAQFQDEFGFLGSHKVDMRSLSSVLRFPAETVTRAHDGGTGLDMSQFALPLGNLLVTGGAGAGQGMAIWAHQAAPDTRGPSVGYHIPRAGQTGYPVGAAISVLVHETLDTPSIVNGVTFLVRPVGGAPVSGRIIAAFDDTLTFTPDQPLAPDTTYEVLLPAGGIRDAAGNGMEGYAFTFSTGSSLSGNQPPVISAFTSSPHPAAPGEPVTLAADALDPEEAPLEFRFDAGDGSALSSWSTNRVHAHVYATAGHHAATVQVRDPAGALVTRGTVVSVLPAAATGPAPRQSSPVAGDPARRRVWTVNPDANTVTLVDADSLAVLAETPVGAGPRAVAVDNAGFAWVSCHLSDRVDILAPDGTPQDSLALDYGSAPFGVVISPDGATAYVALQGKGQIARFNTATRQRTGTLAVGPTPRALAIRGDGSVLYATRFLSPRHRGEVYEVTTAGWAWARTLVIPKFGGELHRDGTASGRGTLNYLASVCLSPDGSRLLVAGTKPNVDRGALFADDHTPDNTVRSVVARLDAASGALVDALDIDNSDSPSAVAFSPAGDYFFVALQGNDEIAVLDAFLAESSAGLGGFVSRRAVGAAPQGLWFDPVSTRLFTHNFLGRDLSVFDLEGFLRTGAWTAEPAVVATVASEPLPPAVLQGKRLFYHAGDPRMSAEGYLSCATCHLDGGHDGRTWDFSGRGEGLRNTTDLRGRAGMGQGNVHWSGNFDEIQDFEHDIRRAFGGRGFLSDADFDAAPTPLGPAKAGRSPDLDALAAYVASLGASHLPRSPHRQADGSLTAAALAGRDHFLQLGCTTCHGGPDLTDSASPAGTLHDVGTRRTTSGGRLGGPLPGIDTPTLRGLWDTASYLHDGSAASLAAVFTTAGGVVIPGESGAVAGGAQVFTGLSVYINGDDALHGRGLVALDGVGESVAFSGVDGGPGGPGALELRYSNAGPIGVTLRVNGADRAVNLPGTGNTPSWSHQNWESLRIEDVPLLPGASNLIQFIALGPWPNLQIDEITVSTAANRAAAEPHHRVRSLDASAQGELLAFLHQLDGQPVSLGSGAAPAVSVSTWDDPADPTDRTRLPYADFAVEFSRAVAGFTAGELEFGGTAQPAWAVLHEVDPGLRYRARVGGVAGDGTLTLRVPAGAAEAVDDQTASAASTTAVFQVDVTLPDLDPLAPLGDEFDRAETLSEWINNDTAEGWNADKHEVRDIHTSRPGHLRVMPRTSSWYQNYTGAFTYKEITGDFVATLDLDVRRRNNQPGRPSAAYSLAGIMVRASRNVTAAAPVPDPGPGVVLPWPPPPPGQPGHYATDWAPGTENYVFLSFGNTDTIWGNVPNTWYYEVKTTLNSVSTLYGTQLAVPANTSRTMLQVARVGQTLLLLRRAEGGEWLVENRFTRDDFPATLQVGLTSYTDYFAIASLDPFHHNRIQPANVNPDLVADADSYRFRRPPAGLSEALLLSLPTTRGDGAARTLSSTAASGLLGDVPAQPFNPAPAQDYGAWLAARLPASQLQDPQFTDPNRDADGDGLPNLLDFLVDGSGTEGDPLLLPRLELEEGEPRLSVGRNPRARGFRWAVESSEDLLIWRTLAESADGAVATGPGVLGESEGDHPVVRIADPSPAARIYFRLRASRL